MNRITIVATAAAFTLGVLVTVYFTSNETAEVSTLSMMDQSNTTGTTNMSMTMSSMTKELEGKSGSELDLAFIEGMLEHHKGAVAMAEMIVSETKRPELQGMAEAIIETQTEEITTMEGWLKQWYGR